MRNIALSIITGALLVGCARESDKPKAEASVSVNVGDKKSDTLQDNLDKAGENLKKGAHEVKAKLDDAGDAIKDKMQAAKDKLTDDKKAEVKVEVKN